MCAGGAALGDVQAHAEGFDFEKRHVVDALQRACSSGNLAVAGWLVDRYYAGALSPGDVDGALRCACGGGSLAAAQWLAARFGPSREKNNLEAALCAACEHGRLELVRWLVAEFYACPCACARAPVEAALRAACTYGRLDVARWLTAAFGLSPGARSPACCARPLGPAAANYMLFDACEAILSKTKSP